MLARLTRVLCGLVLALIIISLGLQAFDRALRIELPDVKQPPVVQPAPKYKPMQPATSLREWEEQKKLPVTQPKV